MLKKYWIVFFALFTSPLLADQVWDIRSQSQLESLEVALQDATVVVSGESHYDPATVAVHARIARALGKGTVIGWEFLNIIDKESIALTISRLQEGHLSLDEALALLFPGQEAPVEYSELLKVVADGEASLVPTNLTRAQKQPVTRNGIEAVDPELLPPGFAMGSDLYFERFKEAMGPHPLPNPIENYFASQCLTDDVMAYALLQSEGSKRLLVTGSFHGDYREGAVRRLDVRSPSGGVLYVKVAHASDFEEEDIKASLVDPRYGSIADILYLIED